MNVIPDVQSSVDVRNLPIQQVGIKNLRFPLQWASANGPQATVALLTMTVYLPADQKGTHMSRFVQLTQKVYWRRQRKFAFKQISLKTAP